MSGRLDPEFGMKMMEMKVAEMKAIHLVNSAEINAHEN